MNGNWLVWFEKKTIRLTSVQQALAMSCIYKCPVSFRARWSATAKVTWNFRQWADLSASSKSAVLICKYLAVYVFIGPPQWCWEGRRLCFQCIESGKIWSVCWFHCIHFGWCQRIKPSRWKLNKCEALWLRICNLQLTFAAQNRQQKWASDAGPKMASQHEIWVARFSTGSSE